MAEILTLTPRQEARDVIQRWQIDQVVAALVPALIASQAALPSEARYIATRAVLSNDEAYCLAATWLMAEAIFWAKNPALEGHPLIRIGGDDLIAVKAREGYVKQAQAALAAAFRVFEGLTPDRVREAASAVQQHEADKLEVARS